VSRTVLLLFASREGQTSKIAARIAEHLQQAGEEVLLADAADASAIAGIDISACDLLVFGASMHAGGLEREMLKYVEANADQIRAKPRSFFLVSLSAATKDPALKAEYLADAKNKTLTQLAVGFPDMEMIAGALAYSRYPVLVKWLMKKIAARVGEGTDSSRDHEYTDWQQVAQYAARLAQSPLPELNA
jgi:menaquinone-dependent protoporphyrinogen oxidase